MTLEELKETVRKLIGGARTKEAIAKITNWAKENNQERLKTDVSTIQGTFAELNREKMLGLLSSSEASTRQNKITYSVLDLLDNVNSNNPIPNNPNVNNPPATSSKKMKILMLTANPANTTKLNLDKERSDIIQKLQQKQEYFRIILEKTVSRSEFKEFIQREQPDILHFSGHGEQAGIVVQDDDKRDGEIINTKGLKSLFKFLKKHVNIKVVLLNACHTQEQAATISEYVDYVIGTNVAIGDSAANAFSCGFYYQLAEGKQTNIEDAFDSGRVEAVMKGADEENFVIYKNGELTEIS